MLLIDGGLPSEEKPGAHSSTPSSRQPLPPPPLAPSCSPWPSSRKPSQRSTLGWSTAHEARTSSTFLPSEERGALYSLTATVAPCSLARRTTDEVPSPRVAPRSRSSKRTCSSEARAGAGATHGFPATASHVSFDISSSHGGRDGRRLFARRRSSSSRIAPIDAGSDSRRLLASMSLRMRTSVPRLSGSAVSLLSVRMSHCSDGGRGASPSERRRHDLKLSMRSLGSAATVGGIASKWLPRAKSVSRDSGSEGRVRSALWDTSSFTSAGKPATATGSSL
mmetsp:Transcript_10503/g.30456  ORF Transcript_10503/g.30456 Transcript_10503/m.30456 type:complete len:279 (-) Transcript_10503:322-1158(-)